jgi:hypothetical protein
MGSFPWGPHGPETSPHEGKPNATAPEPVPQFGQADSYTAPPIAGSASGGPHPILSITVSLLMIPLVWMFWICLYPLTAAAALFTGLITTAMLSRVLTAADEASVAQLGGVIAGFAAAVIVSRLEYKLTQNPPLRLARHVVRLILFGLLVIPWFQGVVRNANIAGSSTRYIFVVLSNPKILAAQLANPQNLVTIFVVIIVMHFLLWKAEKLRAFWHRRLFWLGLK